ncbi:hypothetical protein IGI04_002244 [Brassica rapa subsp. trilocularis]|uniref:Uncharacterized protein n=1 Tax=Brassica rapa subsp. trilocularis TaxID=1813537 RepID=A0ABQ7NV04_BRACM|nr:hypothetical protein IGI04_002244 [Brassica rapa subsp. trilocularis]
MTKINHGQGYNIDVAEHHTTSSYLHLRLWYCFEEIVFVWLTQEAASDAASERHALQTSSSLVSISDTDLELSHFHLTQPQALSSPYLELSHLHLLDLSHLHLISRPRALSSLMQHELSLLL